MAANVSAPSCKPFPYLLRWPCFCCRCFKRFERLQSPSLVMTQVGELPEQEVHQVWVRLQHNSARPAGYTDYCGLLPLSPRPHRSQKLYAHPNNCWLYTSTSPSACLYTSMGNSGSYMGEKEKGDKQPFLQEEP